LDLEGSKKLKQPTKSFKVIALLYLMDRNRLLDFLYYNHVSILYGS